MVSDDPSRPSLRFDADEPTAAGGVDDETYDLIYRATREAIWDVLGTATLILFYVALAAIAVSIAFGGIGPFLRGSASYLALGIGIVALTVGVFATLRIYRLVTE